MKSSNTISKSSPKKVRNDQLDWFSLSNYDRLKELSKAEWLDQLLIRKRIIDLLANKIEDIPPTVIRKINFFVELITTEPVIDFKSTSFVTQFGDYKTVASDFDEYWNWNSSLGIHQLTLEEAMRSIRGVDEHRIDQINQYLNNSVMTHQNEGANERAQDWFSYSLDSMKNDFIQHLTLMVDLSVPDELLVDQFRAQLKIYRKKLGADTPVTSDIKSFDSVKFIKYGVLPYIDIKYIWGRLNELKKSQQFIADLITDVEYAWDAGNLSKTTILWADLALSAPFLNKLSIEAQINNLAAVI